MTQESKNELIMLINDTLDKLKGVEPNRNSFLYLKSASASTLTIFSNEFDKLSKENSFPDDIENLVSGFIKRSLNKRSLIPSDDKTPKTYKDFLDSIRDELNVLLASIALSYASAHWVNPCLILK